ncbi:MAG TPA: hypothetical protein VF593_04085 [Chthoniobacteraceae bacterium]|jgi:hypothetical protein
MLRAPLRFAFLLTAPAILLLSGCADLPPGERGVFSTNAGVAAGDLARASTVTSAESMATGSSAGTIVTATVQVITTHRATERQRKIAEQRARAAFAKIQAREERAAQRETTVARRKNPGSAAKPAKRTSDSVERAEQKPKMAARRRSVRYLAVETEKDARTSPQAEKSIMIFDTETQEIVGNNVYDVRSTPRVGGISKFETYTAEYVGAGL